MKTAMKIVLGAAVLLVIGGLLGMFFFNGALGRSPVVRTNNFNFSSGMMGDYDNSFGRGMWGGNDIYDDANTGEKIDFEELEQSVSRYIDQYEEELVISDIFVFENSDYYFSIMEADTGLGAMELLVNPYTGDIYPEFGPNMMWNQKYGMHGSGGYGMMGRSRGMMGRGNYSNSFSSNETERNAISSEDAQSAAAQYIDDKTDEDYTVSSEGHEFYGYYTFHLEQDGETVGMLSVNGFTGEVWYHSWHGTVERVIDGHVE